MQDIYFLGKEIVERSQFRELFSFYRFKLSGSIISDKKERISVENATFVALKIETL